MNIRYKTLYENLLPKAIIGITWILLIANSNCDAARETYIANNELMLTQHLNST